MDRGQAGVAGSCAVSSLGFQVGEERTDRRGVEVGEVEVDRAGVLAIADKPQEQAEWTSPKSVEAWTMRSSHARDPKEVRPGVS